MTSSIRRCSLVMAGLGSLAIGAIVALVWSSSGNPAAPSFPDEVEALAIVGPTAVPAPPLASEGDIQDAAGGTTRDEIGSGLSIEWEAGFAETLDCNQLSGSTFSDGALPRNFFADPPGRETVVESGGLGGSPALQVGAIDQSGHYAEAVAVSPGRPYWFRGWFNPTDVTAQAQFGVTFLDATYDRLDPGATTSVAMAIDTSRPGFAEVHTVAPLDAAYALPYLVKDSSPGVLLADELVFGVTTECFAEITAAGA